MSDQCDSVGPRSFFWLTSANISFAVSPSCTSCVSGFSLSSRAVCFLPECFYWVFTVLWFFIFYFCEAGVSELLVFCSVDCSVVWGQVINCTRGWESARSKILRGFISPGEQALSEGLESAVSILHWCRDLVEATCSCQGNILRAEWQ